MQASNQPTSMVPDMTYLPESSNVVMLPQVRFAPIHASCFVQSSFKVVFSAQM